MKKKIVKKIRNVILGAILFIVLGRGLVMGMTFYLPASFFYDIHCPISAKYIEEEKELILELGRTSRIETEGETTVEITIVSIEDGAYEDIVFYKRSFITVGEKKIRDRFKLKEPLGSGTYEVRGQVRFTVNDVEKAEKFYSKELVVE